MICEVYEPYCEMAAKRLEKAPQMLLGFENSKAEPGNLFDGMAA